MKKNMMLPLVALLCVSLVIPVASAVFIQTELGTFTVTAYGIGRRLCGFGYGSGGGRYAAKWADFDVDGRCETLIELKLLFTTGSVRVCWYDGSWHRMTVPLSGLSRYWGPSEIMGSGDVWTITDSSGDGFFTITWDGGRLSATVHGSIKVPLAGVTMTACLGGTATLEPP